MIGSVFVAFAHTPQSLSPFDVLYSTNYKISFKNNLLPSKECIIYVSLSSFWNGFSLCTVHQHTMNIYILYRVLNRVLKIVTLFNRIDMFKRINVNAEKKNERKNLLKLSRAKHHRLNVCDWSKGSFKKNMHSRIWQNNNNIEQCTHHCLLLKMP